MHFSWCGPLLLDVSMMIIDYEINMQDAQEKDTSPCLSIICANYHS